ncbi:hypothetical protein [Ferrimonas balearica]|uniref:hypothetical protein n=1 Tax=Ferrimonas balearica TaxID=44012 RepID=UPI001C937610|nr:hypothetical protein [Ferrimonas balearica]MBY5981265.1 hypothetical protein [Ferrimonas balearica]
MAITPKPRKCSECGKRRVPAKRNNGRLSTKCKECFGGLFWRSQFGKWFAEAAKRQSPDSMPFDEQDIEGIYHLWVTRKQGMGWSMKRGKLEPKFDYHICHRDPAKGDGCQGRFTTANLMVAPAKVNQSAKNKNPIDHGHRIYTAKLPFSSAAKVRQWCGGKYDLNGLVDKLNLKAASTKSSDINPEWLPVGIAPSLMMEQQLMRFDGGTLEPWSRTLMSPSAAFEGALVYGIGTGTGRVLEADEATSEEPEEEF